MLTLALLTQLRSLYGTTKMISLMEMGSQYMKVKTALVPLKACFSLQQSNLSRNMEKKDK